MSSFRFLQNMTGFITQQFHKNISSQDYWVEGLTAQNIYLYKNMGGTKTKKVWISQAAQVTTFCARNLLLGLNISTPQCYREQTINPLE